MLKNSASHAGQTIRSHSVQFSWSFGRNKVQKHKVSLGVLVMLKNYAFRASPIICSHSFQFSQSFGWHQVQNHKVSLGVLIMFKTKFPGWTWQFGHVIFSFHGLLDGIKSKNINCLGMLIMLKISASSVAQIIRSNSVQFSWSFGTTSSQQIKCL